MTEKPPIPPPLPDFVCTDSPASKRTVAKRRQVKTRTGSHILTVICTANFLLGFCFCYLSWIWYDLQNPRLTIQPNSNGIVVSPQSMKTFYDSISENSTNEAIEEALNTIRVSTENQVDVEMEHSSSGRLTRVTIDHWIIDIAYKDNKVNHKILYYRFGEKSFATPSDTNGNQK